jgi:hypothetical protein
MSTVATPRPSALARVSALGGVAYVVFFIVGTILLYAGAPDNDSPPAEIVKYYSDSGHRDRIGVGWIVAGLGIFFFLWFLGRLRQTVRRHEGGDGFLTAVTTIGGGVYATLAFAAIAVNMGIRTMSDDTYNHQVFPDLIHAADDASYILHATGGAGAAAMVIAATLAARRARIIAPWVGVLGVIAGICALASIFFFTQIALALWIAIVSVLLFLRGTTDDAPETPLP